VNVDEDNLDAACSVSTATLCNPGSTTEPSGCNVTDCCE
jgi:hypothetical protein